MEPTTRFSLSELALWLTVIFTVLRVCEIIDWPWWVILMPLFVNVVILIILLCLVGALVIKKAKDDKNEGI